ncbi:hypothetical protein [Pluralibacter gergoviae]|nr:hypothetical protein [Pluralibacter gergoviae]
MAWQTGSGIFKLVVMAIIDLTCHSFKVSEDEDEDEDNVTNCHNLYDN